MLNNKRVQQLIEFLSNFASDGGNMSVEFTFIISTSDANLVQ